MGKKTEKSETKVKGANIFDKLMGNEGKHGEKLRHGHPVTETKTTSKGDDDDDED